MTRQVCYIIFVPKKTKQEKIIAELRRKLETTSVHLEQKFEVRNEKLENEMGSVISGNQENQKVSLQDQTSHITPLTSTLYIKKDLLKTLVLSLLAISFELVIYWAWSR